MASQKLFFLHFGVTKLCNDVFGCFLPFTFGNVSEAVEENMLPRKKGSSIWCRGHVELQREAASAFIFLQNLSIVQSHFPAK